VTDSTGRYGIGGMPSGIYDVGALGEERDSNSRALVEPGARRIVLADGAATECDLELAGSTTLRGLVTLNGKPGYGLHVNFDSQANRDGQTVRVHRVCLTDISGAYECTVPEGARGNLSVEGQGGSGYGATLAERTGVDAAGSADAIDFDIAAGLVRIAFQRDGEPVPAGVISRIVLKPGPDSAVVPGFPKDFAWYLTLRGVSQNCEWMLPVGSFVVYLQGTDGLAHEFPSRLTVRAGETTELAIEAERPK